VDVLSSNVTSEVEPQLSDTVTTAGTGTLLHSTVISEGNHGGQEELYLEH